MTDVGCLHVQRFVFAGVPGSIRVDRYVAIGHVHVDKYVFAVVPGCVPVDR